MNKRSAEPRASLPAEVTKRTFPTGIAKIAQIHRLPIFLWATNKEGLTNRHIANMGVADKPTYAHLWQCMSLLCQRHKWIIITAWDPVQHPLHYRHIIALNAKHTTCHYLESNDTALMNLRFKLTFKQIQKCFVPYWMVWVSTWLWLMGITKSPLPTFFSPPHIVWKEDQTSNNFTPIKNRCFSYFFCR